MPRAVRHACSNCSRPIGGSPFAPCCLREVRTRGAPGSARDAELTLIRWATVASGRFINGRRCALHNLLSKLPGCVLLRKSDCEGQGELFSTVQGLPDIRAAFRAQTGQNPAGASISCLSRKSTAHSRPGCEALLKEDRINGDEKKSRKQTRTHRAKQRGQALRSARGRWQVWENCGRRKITLCGSKAQGEDHRSERSRRSGRRKNIAADGINSAQIF